MTVTEIEKVNIFNAVRTKNKNGGHHDRMPKIDTTDLWTDEFGYLYTSEQASSINRHPLNHGKSVCWRCT